MPRRHAAGRRGAAAGRHRRHAAGGHPRQRADHAAAARGPRAGPPGSDAAGRGPAGARRRTGAGVRLRHHARTTPPTSGTPRRSCGPTSPRGCCATGRGRRGVPQRHRRRRRPRRGRRPLRVAVRQLRGGAAVPVRPRHGRARRAPAHPRAAGARRTSARSSRWPRALLAAGRGLRTRRHRLVPRRGPSPSAPGSTDAEAAALAVEYGDDSTTPTTDPPTSPSGGRARRRDELAWPSPWGDGRPGWHAECAAMALTTLGPALDLHVGGADLRYPHHAYEAAMAEAVTGVTPFARAWLHVGTVRARRREDGQAHGQPRARVRCARQAPAGRAAAAAGRPAVGAGVGVRPGRARRAAARLERLYGAAARGALDTGTRRRHARSPPPCSTTSTCPAPSPSPRRRAARRRGSRCRCSG